MSGIARLQQLQDYTQIETAIGFLQRSQPRLPSVRELASAVNLSEFDLQCLLERWAGIRPRHMLHALDQEHSRRLLADAADIFSTFGQVARPM